MLYSCSVLNVDRGAVRYMSAFRMLLNHISSDTWHIKWRTWREPLNLSNIAFVYRMVLFTHINYLQITFNIYILLEQIGLKALRRRHSYCNGQCVAACFIARCCTTLFCIAVCCTHCRVVHRRLLHCSVMHCRVLHCRVLQCRVLHCCVLHCRAMHYCVLHSNELHSNVLYRVQLQCIAACCTAAVVLQRIVLQCDALNRAMGRCNDCRYIHTLFE